MADKQTVKSRFCPSPTGHIHLGNTRTALFSALFALHHQGVFLLRIEDTDPERSKAEYATQLQQDLQWLSLQWQEGPTVEGPAGPYWQSQRQSVYDKYYQQLIEAGAAYPCFCSEQKLAITRKVQRAAGQPPRYPGTCRSLSEQEVSDKLAEGLKATLRFHIPKDQSIEFVDHVKGQQRFATQDLGDFIIRRADGTASFMYCNAIDDALMGVTHVVRGEDHLTNSPRQILLLQALGLPLPEYVHMALIVGSDNSPLSKRHGSKSVLELRDDGYLPTAVINYLARLGHYYPEQDNALLSLQQLAAGFNLQQLGSAPARYNEEQLNFWQKLAVAELEDQALWDWLGSDVQSIVPEERQALFISTIRANITFPVDAYHWAKIFFTDLLEFNQQAMTVITEAGSNFFQTTLDGLEKSGDDYKALVDFVKTQAGVKGKKLFQPLRIAMTGELHGPEMANLIELIGIERVANRFKQAIQIGTQG